jgi:hypothetical protein
MALLVAALAFTLTSAAPSACNNGPYFLSDRDYRFACPEQAMLSDALIEAARGTPFVFATAGGSSDGECGKCYQVRVDGAEILSPPHPLPMLLVQIINSGFDVLQGQLDLYMGAGGFGYFTACNSDCGTRACSGGPCHVPMSGGSFDAWTASLWPDPNPCYSGGIRVLNADDTVERKCRAIKAHPEIIRSCIRSNIMMVHQNFERTAYERVRCPIALVNITGMARVDDDEYPDAHPHLSLGQVCRGNLAMRHFCVTTMQDCCVPSCAWPGKSPTKPGFEAVRVCEK